MLVHPWTVLLGLGHDLAEVMVDPVQMPFELVIHAIFTSG
jgi:hypothetical protein